MASRTNSGPLVEQSPPSGTPPAVGWAALLLGLVGAVTGSLAYFGKSGGGGAGRGGVPDDLDGRLAAHASTLRSELQDDFRRQVKEAQDTFVKAERRIDETRSSVQKVVDEGRRLAENAVRASSDHAETVETKIKEVADQTGKLATTLDQLQTSVKDLESRPIASAARPGPAAVPAPTVPAPKDPDAAPEAPAGPTPEELAAQKAKVDAAIAALASPEIGKVFSACVTLGKLGDLSAVEPLLKVLKEHKDVFAKTAAATALGSIHACDAVPALLQALLDRDDGVTLAAALAFGKIAGVDAGMTGSPTRKERNDAREKWSKWWGANEESVRAKWGQPKGGAGGGEPAPK
ncbi:MAG: HEAT repeat domain-containing protein [Planctomycetota bacterium]